MFTLLHIENHALHIKETDLDDCVSIYTTIQSKNIIWNQPKENIDLCFRPVTINQAYEGNIIGGGFLKYYVPTVKSGNWSMRPQGRLLVDKRKAIRQILDDATEQ